MALEIEHKFLLRDERWRDQVEHSLRMRQGYLVSDATRSVRVRVAGDQGYLNIKSGTLGIARREYEYRIPLAEPDETELDAGSGVSPQRTDPRER